MTSKTIYRFQKNRYLLGLWGLSIGLDIMLLMIASFVTPDFCPCRMPVPQERSRTFNINDIKQIATHDNWHLKTNIFFLENSPLTTKGYIKEYGPNIFEP